MSGIIIPVQRPARPLTETEAQKMNWGRYFGGRERHMPRVGIRKGGAVSFAAHIGKGLTQQLWEDIVFRLQPATLEIYCGDAEIKTIGRAQCVQVFLAVDGRTVQDIKYFPGVVGL